MYYNQRKNRRYFKKWDEVIPTGTINEKGEQLYIAVFDQNPRRIRLVGPSSDGPLQSVQNAPNGWYEIELVFGRKGSSTGREYRKLITFGDWEEIIRRKKYGGFKVKEIPSVFAAYFES